jgi:hypothetical protein
MRKRITRVQSAEPKPQTDEGWLDLEKIAMVEVTSEDPGFPIESALQSPNRPGWRASEPGEQTIRVAFDEPLSLRRIQVRFHEAEFERTQEFVLRWWPAEGGPAREIVRQQWNFSPSGSTTEVEEYAVDLKAVAAVELEVQPDIGGRPVIASLAAMRLR